MSAYKKLNKQDAFITTYTAHKNWNIQQSDFEDYGIAEYRATGKYLNSLQQLYYPNKEGGVAVSHSFDYYQQTTLNFPEDRTLTTGSYIVSIPKSLYGVSVAQGVEITIAVRSTYVAENYWNDVVTEDVAGLFTAVDDGEGRLYISGSIPQNGTYVGDIIYPHGMVIITNQDYIDPNSLGKIPNIKFKSTQPIFTHNYHCKLRESEFNNTYNPSALSGSIKTTYDNEGNIYSTSSIVADGVLSSNITGSTFQPYMTTVGLYNDANQLIAVGKLSRPVPKSANTEMTLIVKIDI